MFVGLFIMCVCVFEGLLMCLCVCGTFDVCLCVCLWDF